MQKYVCREDKGEVTGVRHAKVERIVSTTTSSNGSRSTSVTYKVGIHHAGGHFYLTKSSTNLGEHTVASVVCLCVCVQGVVGVRVCR